MIIHATLLILIAGPSQAQRSSTGHSERERMRQQAAVEPASAHISTTDADSNQCLAPTIEGRGTSLANRCNYPINVMYCDVRDASPSGCQPQTISLPPGASWRAAPWPFKKFRWLACRSPARPVESRQHDGYRIVVEWVCTD